MFDHVDLVLTYQGIPTATGITAYFDGKLDGDIKGHSLGASEVATLKQLGWIKGKASVYALPLGRIAPGGTDVYIGDGDAVNGFLLGKLLNWGADVVKVPWFAHSCDPSEIYGKVLCGRE